MPLQMSGQSTAATKSPAVTGISGPCASNPHPLGGVVQLEEDEEKKTPLKQLSEELEYFKKKVDQSVLALDILTGCFAGQDNFHKRIRLIKKMGALKRLSEKLTIPLKVLKTVSDVEETIRKVRSAINNFDAAFNISTDPKVIEADPKKAIDSFATYFNGHRGCHRRGEYVTAERRE